MVLLLEIDKALFLFLNRTLANPVCDVFMVFITNKHNFYLPIVLIVLCLLMFGGKKGRITVLLALIIIILSDHLSSSLIKPLVRRTRPCHPDVFIEGGRFLIGLKRSFSFPSSHAANITSMAVLFSVKYQRWTVLFGTIALLVSTSRIYVGVHYPSDVLVGCILGGLCSLGILAAENKISHLFKTKQPRETEPGQKEKT